MKKYIVFSILLLGTWACEPTELLPEEGLAPLRGSRCIYDNRETIGLLEKKLGTVRITATATSWSTDIYLDGDEETAYCPCNLPAELSEGGTRVEFSAQLKESIPGENRSCRPIKLTFVRAAPRN